MNCIYAICHPFGFSWGITDVTEINKLLTVLLTQPNVKQVKHHTCDDDMASRAILFRIPTSKRVRPPFAFHSCPTSVHLSVSFLLVNCWWELLIPAPPPAIICQIQSQLCAQQNQLKG